MLNKLKNEIKPISISVLLSSLATVMQMAYFKVRFDYFESNQDVFRLEYFESILYNHVDSIWIYYTFIFVAMTLWSFYIVRKLRW